MSQSHRQRSRRHEPVASCLRLANSTSSPGSIFVSPINAGATPLTVTPFFAYAPASQWIRPCNADFEDLCRLHQSAKSKISSERDAHLRIMRPYNATREPGHTTAEDDSPPAFLLHSRHAQLRQQKGRATVRAPCLLKVVDGDVGYGFNAGLTERGTSVVKEDGGRAKSRCYGRVEATDLGV